MKVIYIDDTNPYWKNRFTIGNIYNVVGSSSHEYILIGDDKLTHYVSKSRFNPLSEIRNETIDKLLE